MSPCSQVAAHRCLPFSSLLASWQWPLTGASKKIRGTTPNGQMGFLAGQTQDKCETHGIYIVLFSNLRNDSSMAYHSLRGPDFMIFHDTSGALLKPTVHAVHRVSGRAPVSVKMCQNHGKRWLPLGLQPRRYQPLSACQILPIFWEQLVGLDLMYKPRSASLNVCVCVCYLFPPKMVLQYCSAPDCFAQECAEMSGNPIHQQG